MKPSSVIAAGAVAGTVHLAAMRLRDKLIRIAAAQFGCAAEAVVFEGGKVFNSAQPARALAFSRLAAGPHWAPALLPEGVEPGLRETAFWTPPTLTAPDAQDRVAHHLQARLAQGARYRQALLASGSAYQLQRNAIALDGQLVFGGAGDPNGAGAPAWPAFEAATDGHLVLDAMIRAGSGVRTERCDALAAALR